MSKLINLFGGPGIGKSSIANGITYKLKKKHISCNNPYEFPKKLAWDQNIPAISDQLYVFANQHRGIAECYGKVDYIVIDSPIMFSTIYHRYYTKGYPAEFYGEPFHNLVIDLHRKYDSINILLDFTNITLIIRHFNVFFALSSVTLLGYAIKLIFQIINFNLAFRNFSFIFFNLHLLLILVSL